MEGEARGRKSERTGERKAERRLHRKEGSSLRMGEEDEGNEKELGNEIRIGK